MATIAPSTQSSTSSPQTNGQNYRGPFAIMSSLFFLWGFMTVFNDILILGGAILPPVQGWMADVTKNLQISFIVPLIAYSYVAFYGAKGHKVGRRDSV